MNPKKWMWYLFKKTGGINEGILNRTVDKNNHLGIGYNFFKELGIDSPNKTFLDVGCGAGELKKLVKSEWFGMDLFNLENAPKSYKTGDIHDMPYMNNTFDIVFCNHVLEHVLSPYVSIMEMGRVIKHDGDLIIGVPILPYFQCSEHIYMLTEKSWEWMISMCGIKIIKSINYDHSVMFHCKVIKASEEQQ